jgi:hypothetical protein
MVLTLISVGVGLVVLCIARRLSPAAEVPAAGEPFYSGHHLSSFLLALVPAYNSRPQKIAHIAVILAIGCLSGFFLIRRRFAERLVGATYSPFLAITVLVVLSVLLLWDAMAVWRISTSALVHRLMLDAVLIGAISALDSLGRRRRRLANQIAFVILIGCLLVATIPGIWRPVDLSRETVQTITTIESHYSLVLGTGYLLSKGRHLWDHDRPYYGVVVPLVTAGLRRLGHLRSIGGWFQFVRLSQAIYLALAILCLRKYSNRRWTDCIIPFALIFPWYHFNHRSILFPNQSGLRILGVAFVTLLAAHISEISDLRWMAAVLGFGTGFACLANIETGVPCAVGALVLLWIRSDDLSANVSLRARAGLWFSASVGATIVLWLVAVRIAAGYWLTDIASGFGMYFHTIRLFAQMNIGGMAFGHDTWPLLMFGHAVYALFSALIGRRDESGRRALRGYASGALIVWFSYYVNRPHEWNLSGFYLLYGFLVVDLARAIRRAHIQRHWSFAAVLALVFYVGGPIPAAINIERSSDFIKSLRGGTPSGVKVSGVFLPSDFAKELVERARFISEGTASPYLTDDSFFVPVLSNSIPRLPFLDAANEVYVEDDFNDLVSSLTTPGASQIFLDAPQSLTRKQGIFHKFYDYVPGAIQPWYEEHEVTHGWTILQRRPQADQRARSQ